MKFLGFSGSSGPYQSTMIVSALGITVGIDTALLIVSAFCKSCPSGKTLEVAVASKSPPCNPASTSVSPLPSFCSPDPFGVPTSVLPLLPSLLASSLPADPDLLCTAVIPSIAPFSPLIFACNDSGICHPTF